MNKLFYACTLLLLFAAQIPAADFHLNQSAGLDSVFFRSTAKLEFIEGTSAAIDGSFSFDPARPDSDVRGILRVDLRTLKTGIDTRDGHMRDRHLHTEKYPYAYFELTGVTGLEPLQAGQKESGDVHGWFYIHGVKRQLSAPIEVVALAGQGSEKVSIRTRFQIILDEYDIPRPKALFLKLAETIEVECIFSGYNNLPASDISLPDWPAKE